MKKCIFCQKKIAGRSDKKYCNVYCRNQYNNNKLNTEKQIHKAIHLILKRNWNILKNLTLQQPNPTKVHFHSMLNEGFNKHFFTHAILEDKIFFCYDYSFSFCDDPLWVMITHHKKVFEL